MTTVAELERIAGGGEADVYAWPTGEVVRLLRDTGEWAELRVERECAAMRAAASAGVRVPALGGAITVDGRPGVLLERIAGPDLLNLVGKKPWLVLRSGGLTGKTHARLNAAAGPESLPASREALRRRIETLVPHEPALFGFVLDVLASLPDGDRLCHGDFHPGQLLMDGDDPVTIDWSNATRGDPLGDYARTRVILSMGSLPPGTTLPLRVLTAVGRRLMVGAYVRGYERECAAPIDRERLEAWETVHVAARIADGYENERAMLAARLRRKKELADAKG
ncbi:MAG: phosphotransferase [Chloroflexi bacterium]|nr:phosphotransferase [Chloroflexota bacterium]